MDRTYGFVCELVSKHILLQRGDREEVRSNKKFQTWRRLLVLKNDIWDWRNTVEGWPLQGLPLFSYKIKKISNQTLWSYWWTEIAWFINLFDRPTYDDLIGLLVITLLANFNQYLIAQCSAWNYLIVQLWITWFYEHLVNLSSLECQLVINLIGQLVIIWSGNFSHYLIVQGEGLSDAVQVEGNTVKIPE